MKIKLKSIHGNVIDDKQSYDTKSVRARIEIGYSYSSNDNLNLNYQIRIGEEEKSFFVIKCIFELENYDQRIEEKEILNQAVEMLQERIEIIIGLISEEMGFEIQG